MMDRQPRKTLRTAARHLVWVETPTRVSDGEGGMSEQWAARTGAQVWASISPIQARNQTQYKTVGVDATHLVRVDGYVEVEEKDRIRFGTRHLEVLTVENLQERSFEKVCTCLERR